jgi:hypothetical protein
MPDIVRDSVVVITFIQARSRARASVESVVIMTAAK